MKKKFVILVALLSASSLFAQREETIIGEHKLGLSGLWGGLSYNVGQFDNNYSGYSGGIWGLEFGKKLYIGGLHYKIDNFRLDNSNTFTLRSNSLLVGFTPISYRSIHPNLSVAIGSGRLDVTGEQEAHVFMLQPTVGLEVNVTRWCHADIGAGYRAVMNSNFVRYSDKSFSGFYGQANLKFGFSWGRYHSGSLSKPISKQTERG